jgi:hypothetical protein
MSTMPRTIRKLMVGLAAVALSAACASAQQVRWETYGAQLQARIDSAQATKDCATLQAALVDATATSGAHERSTGVPNEALEAYVRAALQRAGCPAAS